MTRRSFHIYAILLFVCCALLRFNDGASAQSSTTPPEDEPQTTHPITLGDTWAALSYRFAVSPQELIAAAGSINPHRQPAIASDLAMPQDEQQTGRLLRPLAGGSLEIAARNGRNPWTIAVQNKLDHPYTPLLYTPLFLPGGSLPPRELPPSFDGLAISPPPIYPGAAFALRGRAATTEPVDIALDNRPLIVSRQEDRISALGASGAFLLPGQYLLTIHSAGEPLWEQPVTFSARDWTWDQVTFNNTAVLDVEEIKLERERLRELWDIVTPAALWQGSFSPPINDYVEISSQYGARRSVNGGPYDTYHEGTDFSAYRGTAVTAPAAGRVVLAEELAIRGGAVILDHGLGVHSGYYHLSALHVIPGQTVAAGDLLGEVGSTGRSTGNHLHWDLLIGRTWIDPLAWLDQDLDTWLNTNPGKQSPYAQ